MVARESVVKLTANWHFGDVDHAGELGVLVVVLYDDFLQSVNRLRQLRIQVERHRKMTDPVSAIRSYSCTDFSGAQNSGTCRALRR